MMRSVCARGWSLAGVLVLAGCASIPNTPAQDQAWELVQQCRHVSNVILQRIDPDGQVWVEMRNGTAGYAEWQDCMRKAAQERAAAGKTAAPGR